MQRPDADDAEYVTLGRIVGFFGVNGWVKVHSDTNPRENIVGFNRWWLGQHGAKTEWQQIKVVNGKRNGKNIVARLDGIATREQAAPLMGVDIAVPRSELPQLQHGEIYWTDIVGCMVETTSGVIIGPTLRLFETGANDVLVVRDQRADNNSPSGEVLIPWLRPSVIVEVDSEARRIVVDWDPDF